MPYAGSEYGKLKKVLLCRPEYLSIKNPLNVIAKAHSQGGADIDIQKACREHDEFAAAFSSYGTEVLLAETNPRCPYGINTRDLGVTTEKGIIFGRFLKPMRWGEERLAENTLQANKVPIFYKMDRGIFEGGDFMYLDNKTAAVGRGIRTDEVGFRSLQLALYDVDLELMPVDFHEDYLHLDMICNVVGERVAVVCPEALPQDFLRLLKGKGFRLIDVTREEVFQHACNLLSIGHDTILSHPQAKRVNTMLKALGFKVEVIDLREVLKSGGGPRCMSFPIDRE